MKALKTLFVVTALTTSSLALAEGGGDRTFARMEQARQASMEAYRVAQQQNEKPTVVGEKEKSAKHTNC
ncbi:conserved exported hypothetical protein [Pseudomonas sp. OF001]|uniref:co-regulatory protein PtrA N-terminal domain-containing protein n=1 Tax=unclassified Pseudomonas TaxID=196821 RepID=UPI001917F555|nr:MULTISPECIES: co-regulatory protein PtrA N-terminal domain-containing protein [unclassified Pseudomonas]WPP46089.1 co-regulatory protein PtrA N-terminal domain-containing protein [Pseudomonas sp. AN-1]CAD5379369.1 conserved exported hypothetical protein [Pseudomonas sp. OF001]